MSFELEVTTHFFFAFHTQYIRLMEANLDANFKTPKGMFSKGKIDNPSEGHGVSFYSKKKSRSILF